MGEQSIFVKIDGHEEIQLIMKSIRQKTLDAKEKLQKIRQLDAEEQEKLAEFDQAIEHINTNLDQVSGFLKQ